MDQSSPRYQAPSDSSGRGLTLKERHRQEREELILEAAEAMLLERGYHETSLDEIATRVGISKGTIYLHFPSKEDLVLALADRRMRDFLRALDATLAGPGTPRDKLRAIIAQVYGSMTGQQFHVLASMMQSPELLGRMAERRKQLAELWLEPQRRLSAVFDEGKAAGDFDPAMPTSVMLSLFGGLLSPHSYRRLVIREGMTPEEVTRHLATFFFKGIARETDHTEDTDSTIAP